MLNCPFDVRGRYSISRVAGKYLLAYLDARVYRVNRCDSNVVIKCQTAFSSCAMIARCFLAMFHVDRGENQIHFEES